MVKKTRSKTGKPLEEKVNELYNWYSRMKFFVGAWEILSIWIVTFLGVALFLFVYAKVIGLIKELWPQISLDAKFQGIIATLIFIVGLVIGNRFKKRR
jgi:hypothetical protein